MEENKQMEKEVGKGDRKGSSENFLLEVYLKELCHKISQNSDSGNYHKID